MSLFLFSWSFFIISSCLPPQPMYKPFLFLTVSPDQLENIYQSSAEVMDLLSRPRKNTFFLAIYSEWTSLLTLVGLGWVLKSSKLALGSIFCCILERNRCISSNKAFRYLWKGSVRSHPTMIECLRMVSLSPVMIVKVQHWLSKLWLECPCQLLTFLSEPFISND